MNVDMPAQCVEGVVAGYQMETQMNYRAPVFRFM